MKGLLSVLFAIALFATASPAQDAALINEHAPDGLLGCEVEMFKVRTAYLLCYDADRKVPRWTMYRIIADYRNTPQRKARFSRFRSDPDIDGEAKDAEYRGLLASRGYARGHFTPYGVLGGDRDGDGVRASLTAPSDP